MNNLKTAKYLLELLLRLSPASRPVLPLWTRRDIVFSQKHALVDEVDML